MCNSRQGKFRIRWLILVHLAKYHRRLKKIAPSVQRIHRDIDPNVFNQRFQTVLVATDYFTKWVEAIPLKTVTSKNMVDFVMERIVYRFGIPQTITTD